MNEVEENNNKKNISQILYINYNYLYFCLLFDAKYNFESGIESWYCHDQILSSGCCISFLSFSLSLSYILSILFFNILLLLSKIAEVNQRLDCRKTLLARGRKRSIEKCVRLLQPKNKSVEPKFGKLLAMAACQLTGWFQRISQQNKLKIKKKKK